MVAVRKLYAGVKLREIRTRLGMTQAEYAGALGVSLSYLNQMENNHRPVPARVVLALVQAFDVDMSELAAGSTERTVADLREYRTVVLPDCVALTEAQADLLQGYLEGGGAIVAIGAFGLNLPDENRRAIADHPRCTVLDLNAPFTLDALADEPQVRFVDHAMPDIAVNLQRVEGGVALHLIRYDYDEAADRVPVLPELRLEVRLLRIPGARHALMRGPVDASVGNLAQPAPQLAL